MYWRRCFVFKILILESLPKKIFTVLCVTKIALWHKVICTNMIEDIFIFQKKKCWNTICCNAMANSLTTNLYKTGLNPSTLTISIVAGPKFYFSSELCNAHPLATKLCDKVHVFWEGPKILRNLLLTFVCMY